MKTFLSTLLGAILLDKALANPSGILSPADDSICFRFVPYNDLNHENSLLAGEMGYTEDTWNELGSNNIESLAFADIGAEHMQAAQTMGFTEASWNCWINHYEAFDWEELSSQIRLDVSVLGWDINSWNSRGEVGSYRPASEQLLFQGLSAVEKEAAINLCYTEEIWNEDDLEEWTTLPCFQKMGPPCIRFQPYSHLAVGEKLRAMLLDYTKESWNIPGESSIERVAFANIEASKKDHVEALGFTEIVWDCWVNHYDGFGWNDLATQGVQQHMVALGWNEILWEGRYDVGSQKPESEMKTFYGLSDSEKEAAEGLCFTEDSWNMDNLDDWETLPCVNDIDSVCFRYRPYDELDHSSLLLLPVLGYHEETWNSPGDAYIEDYSFNQLSTAEKEAARSLGFSVASWNCWVNHYTAFEWDDLVKHEVQHYIEALGWNSTSWGMRWTDGDHKPASEFKTFQSLSEIEQNAVTQLCYTQELWDQISLETWTNKPCSEYGGLPLSVDHNRYIFWSELESEARVDAQQYLSYDEGSWNTPGSAMIESFTYESLSEIENGQATVQKLGLSAEQWDCYINHYNGNLWSDLDDDVLLFYTTLGWDESSWNGYSEPPASDTKSWIDLSNSEKTAAEGLCFQEDTWNGWILADFHKYWTDSPTLSPQPPTPKPTTILFPAPTSKPTLAPFSAPTSKPTLAPFPAPTSKPNVAPFPAPTSKPNVAPFPAPTSKPNSVLVPAPTSPSQTPNNSPTQEQNPGASIAPKPKSNNMVIGIAVGLSALLTISIIWYVKKKRGKESNSAWLDEENAKLKFDSNGPSDSELL